jgi:hypothetical protein
MESYIHNISLMFDFVLYNLGMQFELFQIILLYTTDKLAAI